MQVSRLAILAERGRKDIGIVNHVRGQVYGSSDTAIAHRSVPFQGCEEKELKGKGEKKKRDSSRASSRILRYRCSDICDSSPFPFRSLRTSEPSWVISVFKIRSQYVAYVCKA